MTKKEQTTCELKEWSTNTFPNPTEPSGDTSIGYFISWIFSKGEVDCDSIKKAKRQQRHLKRILGDISSIKLKHFKSTMLHSSVAKLVQEEGLKDHMQKLLTSATKTLFLDPAINKGLLSYKILNGGIDKGDQREELRKWVIGKAGKLPPMSEDMTLGQFSALLFKAEEIKITQDLSFKHTRSIFEALFDTTLKELSNDLLHGTVKGLKTNTRRNRQHVKDGFRKYFIKPAEQRGLCNFENLNPSAHEFERLIIEKADGLPPASEDMTVGQFVSWLFLSKNIDTDLMRTVSKPFSEAMLEKIFDTKLKHLTAKDLKEALDSLRKVDGGSKHTMLSLFKRTFLSPAVEIGFLPEYYAEPELRYRVQKQLEVNKELDTKDRTVGYYVAEICERDNLLKNPGVLQQFNNVFFDIWDTKATNLKKEDIPKLTSREQTSFRKIYDRIVKDNLANFDYYGQYETTNTAEDKDLIVIKRGRRQYKFDFSNIHDNKLKAVSKKYIKWRLDHNLKRSQITFRNVKKGFFAFLESKNITLKQFTNTSKKEWLLWLKTSFAPSTGKSVYTDSIQFLKYCHEAHPSSMHKNFSLKSLKSPFKRKKASRHHYLSHERDKIVEALRRHENRQFADIMTLLLLVAKRKGEILLLKRDCLINIVGIKYLKYADTKNRAEKRVPLQSFNLKGSENLFQKDVSSIVEEIIKRQLRYSEKLLPFCHEDDRELLFVREFDGRNKEGYLCGRWSDAAFHTAKAVFTKKHNINFTLEVHRFRHTIASHIIRSGIGIEAASRVLGNTPKTVSIAYETDVSKEETLSLSISPKLSVTEDAKALSQLDKAPIALRKEEADSTSSAMAGGRCMGGEEVKLSCKFYQRLFGNGGCLGCGSLAVTSENRFYYEDIKAELLDELEKVSGTPITASVNAKLGLVNETLRIINNIGD